MNIPKYSTRVQWSDEDGCYVAICPEVDGCSGFGPTPQEATADLSIALELNITARAEEGMSIPEPMKLEEYSGQWRQRVPKDLHAWLMQDAADQGVSMNTRVISLLQHARGQADAFAGMKRDMERLVMLLATTRNASMSAAGSPQATWASPKSTQNGPPTNISTFVRSPNANNPQVMES